MRIREFQPADVPEAKRFTDLIVGDGYYSLTELEEKQKQSITAEGEICSFVVVNAENKILGLRLAYPPKNWSHGKGEKLRPELWPTSLNETAYFQSLFVASELQGQGWGPKLSEKSLAVFKKMGAKGVVAHCWKESPHNSSFRYLKNLGFQEVIEHPLYWFHINYVCTRDGNPCRCTAIEMHLTL